MERDVLSFTGIKLQNGNVDLRFSLSDVRVCVCVCACVYKGRWNPLNAVLNILCMCVCV